KVHVRCPGIPLGYSGIGNGNSVVIVQYRANSLAVRYRRKYFAPGGKPSIRLEEIDGEGFVRFDRGVSDNGNRDRLRRDTRVKDQSPALGNVIDRPAIETTV